MHQGVKRDPAVEPHARLFIRAQDRHRGPGSDPPADHRVGLIVGAVGQRREPGLLELIGDVARGLEASAGTGWPSLQLRPREIGDIAPGPLHVELAGQVGKLRLQAAARQQRARAP